MSKNKISEIVSNDFVTDDVFLITAKFDERPLPGQFLMLTFADGRLDPFLPRPISVFDWNDGIVSFLIKIVGKGTRLLSKMKIGEKLRIVGYLGNNFPDNSGSVFFIGGGIGAAPLFYSAKTSSAAKKLFILGFKNRDSLFMTKKFGEIAPLIVTTDDKSLSELSYPHEALKIELERGNIPDMICVCGPKMMMEAIQKVAEKYEKIEIYHSFESQMACGIGACLGCRVTTAGGSYLVCKEGPVFKGREIFPS